MTLPPAVLPPDIIIMSDIAGVRIESAWDTQELLHSLLYAAGNAAGISYDMHEDRECHSHKETTNQ